MRKLLLTKGIKFRYVFIFLMVTMCSLSANAQGSLSVSGKISDKGDGNMIPGASIVEKGTSNGTITDLDGNFSLKVAGETSVLIVSFIGYDNQEVTVGKNTTINVALSVGGVDLDEVVVVGYGTMKKRDVTGSVSSMKGESLNTAPVASAAEALTGRLAGVQVTTVEGSPDADISIRIRGGGSITQDNSPLYIVDGFPVSTISDIPSSEIQSIDVLKDASSTAIYGSRGANGVIIITTKSGKSGKVKVNYNAYQGYSQVANSLNTLPVDDYIKYQWEWAALADKQDSYEQFFGLYQDRDLYQGQPSIDWYDQVFGRTGSVFNHDLNVTGGSDKFNYSLGYAGRNSKEIMLGSEYKRSNVSFKMNSKPTENVDLAFQLRYSDTEVKGGGAIEQTGATPTDSRVRQSISFLPLPFNTFGDFSDDDVSSQLTNPLQAVADNDRVQTYQRFSLGSSFSWDITEGLTLKLDAGLNSYVRNDDRFRGTSTYWASTAPPVDYLGMPGVQSYRRNSMTLRSANTLQYDLNTLLGKDSPHSLKLLLGQEWVQTKSNTAYNEVVGFDTFYTSTDAFNLSSQGFSSRYYNTINPVDKLLSFFGRANYSYKGKYLLSATFRTDGSSKFGKTNKWGQFPSLAAAWRIAEEDFMKGTTDVLSDLKLRLSYGASGNNNIPANQIKQIYESSTTTYINDISSIWAPADEMANADLKWETTYTRNLGIDFGLFKNRISGSAELYYNTTNDLLIEFPVPGSGYKTQYRNMGETENKGLELSLTIVAIDKKDYGLDIGFNIGFNRNKINSLGVMNSFGAGTSWASTEIANEYWLAVDGSVGEMNGYVSDGRYEVSDFNYDAVGGWTLKEGVADASEIFGKLRPGMMKLKDIAGDDGKITTDDVKIIGNANPLNSGGISLTGRAYGFDLSAIFNWSYGNDVYNANKVEFTTGRFQFTNLIDEMADGKRWTNIDPSTGLVVDEPAALEALNTNTTMWSPYMTKRVFSDWAVEDASFIRLNTLSLGYTLPKEIISKLKIQNLRFYATCYNVFVLTNYSGLDPEVSSRRQSGLTPGVDYSAYPRSRQFLFGLNLTF